MVAVSAFAADAPLSDLLKTVEQRYNHTDTLQVLFHLDYAKVGHAHRKESGVLDLRKPGRMRWEYSDPQGKLAIGDGKFFWQYFPDRNEVEKTPLRDSDDSPIAFLLGRLHFEKEFQNLQGKPEGADTRITAQPKTDALPYTGVELLVTHEGRIREVKVTGFDNGVMTYTFDQEKMGPKLEEKLFQFQMPKGAQMVEPNK
jgi:outer membrane lipoprotein carrier protein